MERVRVFALTKALLCNSTTREPTVGELRFIARLKKKALPKGPTASDVEGGSVIEGGDVLLVNGQTRSKCRPLVAYVLSPKLTLPQSTLVNTSSTTKYTVCQGLVSVRLRPFRGPWSQLTCSHEAAWMIIPGTGYESSSGGPFFR